MECDGPPSVYRLSHLLLFSTCLVCVFSFSSAYSLPHRVATQQGPMLAKREVYMGLRLHCMVHPRNCPARVLFNGGRRNRASIRAGKRTSEVPEQPLQHHEQTLHEELQKLLAILLGQRAAAEASDKELW